MSGKLTPRRLSQIGFLAGVLAGALAFVAAEHHEISFVCFVVVWYAFGYGVTRASAHPEHRGHWLVHILLFPAVWVVGVPVLWIVLDNAVGAILLAGAAALLVQLVVTNVLLRDVRADQQHDLRHRLGIE